MRWLPLSLGTLVAVLGAALLTVRLTAGQPAPPDPDTALVTRVLSGDTIEVQLPDGSAATVTYLGIRAPGMPAQSANGFSLECYGVEARERNAALVDGQTVRLERDVTERDADGRLPRHIFLDDGTHINAVLVAEGFATTRTEPPDTRYADQMRGLEDEARVNNRGLWGACFVNNPDS